MDFWDVLFNNFDITLLIFGRILGIFSFNPMLSRSNIPVIARIGLSMLITYIVSLTLNIQTADTGNTMGEYAMCFIREFLIGLILGYVCNIFVMMIYAAGDVMDSQAGMGMAKVFDPSTSIQMSIFGSVSGFMMYLYFFVSNAHMTLIRIFTDSFDVIPLAGEGVINGELGWRTVELFSEVFVLAMQLAMPVIAAELIVEFSMGILMKAVPQIQIMVVNIQLKVAVGFIILLAITRPLSDFIGRYTEQMLVSCREMLPLIFS